MLDRLATASRVSLWNNTSISPLCKICDQHLEDRQHLFFSCDYSKEVWRQVLQYIQKQPLANTSLELDCVIKKARSKKSLDKAYIMLYTESVYAIWLQRNNKVFKNTLLASNLLVKEIIFRVSCRCCELERQLLSS